jgi:hypothetical protein
MNYDKLATSRLPNPPIPLFWPTHLTHAAESNLGHWRGTLELDQFRLALVPMSSDPTDSGLLKFFQSIGEDLVVFFYFFIPGILWAVPNGQVSS